MAALLSDPAVPLYWKVRCGLGGAGTSSVNGKPLKVPVPEPEMLVPDAREASLCLSQRLSLASSCFQKPREV